MRLLHEDRKLGLVRLRLETPSDLWRVARLVRAGDRVGASTTRRDPEAPAETKSAERERRRVWLVVQVEQTDFQGLGATRVRFTGPIVEGPFDQGRHHTLELAEGSELTVHKDGFSAADRALIEEGRTAADEPVLLLAAVDWGESTLVRLRGRVVQTVAEVNRTLAGKRYGHEGAEKDRSRYRAELAELVAGHADEAAAILIAGPGFFKEELAAAVIERAPGTKEKLRILSTAQAGGAGVHELLRSGRASEMLRGSVAAEEAKLVEQLVTALGGGRRAAVGPREVGLALEAGAVETMLVGEATLTDPAIVELLERARSGRVRVLIVGHEGEAGRRLSGLGGIGALLRFDWIAPRPSGPS